MIKPILHRWKSTTNLFSVVVLVCCLGSSHATTPRFSFFGRKSNSTNVVVPAAAAAIPSSESSWSNFLTIDPSNILKIMIQRGGLILPKSIQEELLAVAKVCHVDQVQWNAVQKRLMMTNFTVTAPGMQTPSLRVGRLFVSWESYTKPCLNIEVDDVDVLLEFTNLLLTKNNWNELYRAGFPPPMMAAESEGETSDYSFVRIGSMDLSGNLKAEIRSRPLDGREVCAPWMLDLDTFDVMNTELQLLSDNNLVQTGRRGCTTLQLYDWLETYVGGKMRAALSATAFDLASQPFADADTDTVRRAKGFLNEARKTVFSYANHASKKSGRDLQDNVMGRLDAMGVKDRVEATALKLGTARSIVLDLNETVVDDTVSKIKSTYQSLREAALDRLTNVKGALNAAEDADVGQPEIIFPPDR